MPRINFDVTQPTPVYLGRPIEYNFDHSTFVQDVRTVLSSSNNTIKLTNYDSILFYYAYSMMCEALKGIFVEEKPSIIFIDYYTSMVINREEYYRKSFKNQTPDFRIFQYNQLMIMYDIIKYERNMVPENVLSLEFSHRILLRYDKLLEKINDQIATLSPESIEDEE